MPFVPLKIPPGIVNKGTEYQTKGRWRDGNFIRWTDGILQPVGGWRRISPAPATGRVSGLLPFRDNRQFAYIGVGTNSHLYVLSQGSLTDITPAGFAPGPANTAVGSGYGAGPYGMGTYGTPRAGGTTQLMRQAVTWSFDTWGEFLVAVSSYDGTPYVWRPATVDTPADAVAEPIPNAPVDCTGLVVTPERHLVVLRPDMRQRVVAWSDREDYTTWAATPTNLAGEITLQTHGTLMRGLRVNDGVLILGDTDAFFMRYVGAPLAYGIDQVGSDCGVIGKNAAVSFDGNVAWMGKSGFFYYDGAVRVLRCEVYDWVFREFDDFQGELVSAGHNAGHSEIWWFFPTIGDQRNTRYVTWNYETNVWSVGYLERTCWQGQGPWELPIAASLNGHIYEHEVPMREPFNQREKPWVESSPIEIGSGNQVAHVMELVPDEDDQSLEALRFFFTAKQAPRRTSRTYGPFTPNASGFIPTRFQGRQLELKVEAAQDVDWRMGVLRADIRPGGRR